MKSFSELPVENCVDLLLNDPVDITAFYDQYGPLIFGVVCKIIPGKNAAENAFVVIFKKIVENLKCYERTRGSFTNWLANNARDFAITRLVTQHGGYDAIKCTPSLSFTEKTIYVLYTYHLSSLENISALLQLPTATVYKHLVNANTKIGKASTRTHQSGT
jgi:hypothetical protein